MLCSLAKNKEEKAVEHEKKKSGEVSSSGEFSAFIKNLSVTTTTEALKAAFAHCGNIASVRIPVNTATGKARGFGFVDFQDQKSLDKALKMKKMTLDGRQILIEHAASKKRSQ
jgi:RNA recognition motif-containing protein